MLLHVIRQCKRTVFILPLITCTVLLSCKQQPNRPSRKITPAFYYWKSVFNPTFSEWQKLDDLSVSTMYIRFFDIGWNEELHQSTPMAIIRFTGHQSASLHKINLIPTIFITNDCIRKLDTSNKFLLAQKIITLIKSIGDQNNLKPFQEIQIDCDWSATTREQYFSLLRMLKQTDPSFRYSATIRLHQVKYLSRTGVPPVDRGLLMCYNMGNLRNPASVNSILDPDELKKYAANLAQYPLPLDIGLPLFDWSVLFKNGVYAGLLKISPARLPDGTVRKSSGNWYVFNKDTVLQGFPCQKGDQIRYESSSINDILETCQFIKSRWKDTSATVSLFHMDSIILQKYPTHELENIYNSLR